MLNNLNLDLNIASYILKGKTVQRGCHIDIERGKI